MVLAATGMNGLMTPFLKLSGHVLTPDVNGSIAAVIFNVIFIVIFISFLPEIDSHRPHHHNLANTQHLILPHRHLEVDQRVNLLSSHHMPNLIFTWVIDDRNWFTGVEVSTEVSIDRFAVFILSFFL